VTTTANPACCTLADLADHRFVTVTARILAVEPKHQDTSRPWAVVTLTSDGELAEVHVRPLEYADTSEHLRVGNRVVVSGETAQDADGWFMRAHTIHPIGDLR
jgi:DNA polymerase III alpha subunit